MTAGTLSPLRASEQPNIVFILVDDLGWSDLGCYGHAWHETPNINRLASEGMRFTSAYSPAPICSAARASILTGKAVPRLGFEFVTKEAPGRQRIEGDVPLITPPLTLNLPLAETTIAERMAMQDYQTAFFGKWHVSQHHRRYLGWHPEYGPPKQGFEVAEEDFGDHPYAWTKANRKRESDAGVIPEDSMVQRVCDYIRRPHDRPYFLMASSFYVHTPVKNRCRWLVEKYDAKLPETIPQRSKRLQYAAFVETLDHHVGEILAAIDKSEQRENTLVVFLSDNGGHPEYCGNAPLRGSKWNLYEGGIRVPMIARWPGKITAGASSDTAVIGYDLLPTFVDIASATAISSVQNDVDGISITPLLSNPRLQFDRSLIWHFPYYHPETGFKDAQQSIGVNDFAVSQTRPQSAFRHGRYKIIHFAEDDRIELYDLQTDLAEQHDLSASLPEIAAQMRTRLDTHLTTMNARRALPKEKK
ncbi:arylsulfatase A [Rhodopirellula maiorica SM1]|uniref:Arylsulfatase A n=1 Tax=Rhodopirellula maiorica SM1 TaxID=1265738 RepID=M5S0M7_9BACT|nr:sulfatase [Rhodopirellula maiorica]EMI21207.1 arylsulfatase A [Rhodopirellula maiorica SM1]